MQCWGPVGSGPALVVPREGRAVVRTLIPTDKVDGGKPRALLEQVVPLIMATLMADVAQEGTGELVPRVPPLLSLQVVRRRQWRDDGGHVVLRHSAPRRASALAPPVGRRFSGR
jgi:hypothetical protein